MSFSPTLLRLYDGRMSVLTPISRESHIDLFSPPALKALDAFSEFAMGSLENSRSSRGSEEPKVPSLVSILTKKNHYKLTETCINKVDTDQKASTFCSKGFMKDIPYQHAHHSSVDTSDKTNAVESLEEVMSTKHDLEVSEAAKHKRTCKKLDDRKELSEKWCEPDPLKVLERKKELLEKTILVVDDSSKYLRKRIAVAKLKETRLRAAAHENISSIRFDASVKSQQIKDHKTRRAILRKNSAEVIRVFSESLSDIPDDKNELEEELLWEVNTMICTVNKMSEVLSKKHRIVKTARVIRLRVMTKDEETCAEHARRAKIDPTPADLSHAHMY